VESSSEPLCAVVVREEKHCGAHPALYPLSRLCQVAGDSSSRVSSQALYCCLSSGVALRGHPTATAESSSPEENTPQRGATAAVVVSLCLCPRRGREG